MRLRTAILREMTSIVKRNAIIAGATCSRALSQPVVLDSPTEEHLRHARGVYIGPDSRLHVHIFDNYDESHSTLPAESLPTDVLLSILDKM